MSARRIEPGQRFEETRRAARVWEVEAVIADAEPPRVRLRDVRFRSLRRTVPSSALLDMTQYLPVEPGRPDGGG
ncbi:MAG: hypothetical protein RID91_12175 [Azospirillaceae bacterium]